MLPRDVATPNKKQVSSTQRRESRHRKIHITKKLKLFVSLLLSLFLSLFTQSPLPSACSGLLIFVPISYLSHNLLLHCTYYLLFSYVYTYTTLFLSVERSSFICFHNYVNMIKRGGVKKDVVEDCKNV